MRYRIQRTRALLVKRMWEWVLGGRACIILNESSEITHLAATGTKIHIPGGTLRGVTIRGATVTTPFGSGPVIENCVIILTGPGPALRVAHDWEPG